MLTCLFCGVDLEDTELVLPVLGVIDPFSRIGQDRAKFVHSEPRGYIHLSHLVEFYQRGTNNEVAQKETEPQSRGENSSSAP